MIQMCGLCDNSIKINRENHDGVQPKMIAFWKSDEKKQDILAPFDRRYENFIDFVHQMDHHSASENRPRKLLSSSYCKQISCERKAALVNEFVVGLLKKDERLKKSLDDYADRWIKPISREIQPQTDENGIMYSSANYQKLMKNVVELNHSKFLQHFLASRENKYLVSRISKKKPAASVIQFIMNKAHWF